MVYCQPVGGGLLPLIFVCGCDHRERMAILGFDLDEIARLIALLETQGLDELIVADGDRSLRIRAARRTQAIEQPGYPVRQIAAARAQRSITAAPIEEPASVADEIVLVSPMVGVFFRCEKPGGPPLVEVGDAVAVGQAVGILESMKVFSEIPAEHSGVVVSIPARDGELVRSGTPLLVLRPDSG